MKGNTDLIQINTEICKRPAESDKKKVQRLRVHKIVYWFSGPGEKNCQSSLIFYCKIPILCQSLVKSSPILLFTSDRTDKFREH